MRDMVSEAILNRERVVHDIRERTDVLKIALDRTFGLSHRSQLVPGPRGWVRVVQGEALPPNPGFDSLASAYVAFTGDSDFQRMGKPRIVQTGTPDFASALADTMSNLLLRDYVEEFRWRELVTQTTRLEDFRPQTRTRLRHVEDLPDVEEDTGYDELVTHGDEGYTVTANTKGGLLTLTRRMLMGDGIGAVNRLVEQARRAAERTLAKAVWDLPIENRSYRVDDLAWFHVDHGNLGAAALSGTVAESVAVLNGARLAIFSQKEGGSNERLGLSGPWLLVVPIELEEVARKINVGLFIDASLTPNPWYHAFGVNNERIFANPLMSNATDWLMFDVSGRAGIVEIGFLMGQQSPQITVANDPTRGGTFLQDRIRYRVRHEYEVSVADYRSAYKAVVA